MMRHFWGYLQICPVNKKKPVTQSQDVAKKYAAGLLSQDQLYDCRDELIRERKLNRVEKPRVLKRPAECSKRKERQNEHATIKSEPTKRRNKVEPNDMNAEVKMFERDTSARLDIPEEKNAVEAAPFDVVQFEPPPAFGLLDEFWDLV